MNAAGKLPPELSRLYFSPTRPMFELYDLESDPHEFNNLIGKREAAETERELKAALQEWMILERDFLPLPIPGAAAAKKPATKQGATGPKGPKKERKKKL